MTRIFTSFRRMKRDSRAATAVEFALAAPIAFMMLFGVFQVGMLMLSYNSMRGLAGEMGRYTVVQYMTGNKISDTQIETAAIERGNRSGSGLNTAHLNVDAVTATTSSVPGVKQIDLTITYGVPNVLPFYPGQTFDMTITKPILVYNS